MAKQHYYAFYFDASACSGCKACQIACKDKYDLIVGVLWRRVYEVEGGEWVKAGEVWQQDVQVYNVSLACNHCEKPICLEVCPAGAITQRNDGIVLIDPELCIGCEYCAWACPYGAPQYDHVRGVMTKCTFCYDLIDQGKAPACVSACPMRALDYGLKEELEAKYGAAAAIFPLPRAVLTEPGLVITPHRHAAPANSKEVHIANQEEV